MKHSQTAQHTQDGTHDTTNSADFTGTCFDLESPAVRGGSTSQAWSQSTVCGPLACGPNGQTQLTGWKRPRQESSWQKVYSNKRSSCFNSAQNEPIEHLDDCDGEEEVQSTFKATATACPALVKSSPSVPVPSQQDHHVSKLHNMKSSAQLSFPVQRRASAGNQHQVKANSGIQKQQCRKSTGFFRHINYYFTPADLPSNMHPEE
ncbi:hypothetical protein WJX74_008713 [Apatococcus lobatus]|uniref:Uncharacterized protein n=1 Tax=Apatococcus lobatus TaxID=904363 RepID=A0AAW1S5S5_9CHLO